MNELQRENIINLCSVDTMHSTLKVRRLLRMKEEEEVTINYRINAILDILEPDKEKKRKMLKKINEKSSKLIDEFNTEENEGDNNSGDSSRDIFSKIKNHMNNKT